MKAAIRGVRELCHRPAATLCPCWGRWLQAVTGLKRHLARHKPNRGSPPTPAKEWNAPVGSAQLPHGRATLELPWHSGPGPAQAHAASTAPCCSLLLPLPHRLTSLSLLPLPRALLFARHHWNMDFLWLLLPTKVCHVLMVAAIPAPYPMALLALWLSLPVTAICQPPALTRLWSHSKASLGSHTLLGPLSW